tara:strand:- start:12816 stop:12983 length:168 start_codon:yes stop_codon:yes gene_type:complete
MVFTGEMALVVCRLEWALWWATTVAYIRPHKAKKDLMRGRQLGWLLASMRAGAQP